MNKGVFYHHHLISSLGVGLYLISTKKETSAVNHTYDPIHRSSSPLRSAIYIYVCVCVCLISFIMFMPSNFWKYIVFYAFKILNKVSYKKLLENKRIWKNKIWYTKFKEIF